MNVNKYIFMTLIVVSEFIKKKNKSENMCNKYEAHKVYFTMRV